MPLENSRKKLKRQEIDDITWESGVLSLEEESLKNLQVTKEERGKKGKDAGDRLENKSNESASLEGIWQPKKCVEGKESTAAKPHKRTKSH